MSEIEKMYKTIFGEFAPNCSLCVKLVDCKIFNNTHNCNKFECDYKRLFTAEKQIAILQLLTQRCDLTISHFTEWEFIHYDGQEPLEITGKDFTETFAKLINAYWQNLTVEEKQQVKGILE